MRPPLILAKLPPGDFKRQVNIEARGRAVIGRIPASYDESRPAPLVIALHGGGSNPADFADFCGLNAQSEKSGFIVAYPAGSGRLASALTWNGGACCGYAMRKNIDDVGFLSAVIDDLSRFASVDPRRIYVTGISNGAVMAYRLACELSHRIAAVCAIAGPMELRGCTPQRPISVLHFHGRDDRFVPFAGGVGAKSLSRTAFTSVADTIDAWVRFNGCPPEPTIAELPSVVDDGTHVRTSTYGPGREGSEVVLVEIGGGGHTWPGRPAKWDMLGVATQNVDANTTMWEFFERHPLV